MIAHTTNTSSTAQVSYMEQESIGAKGAQEEGRQDENTSDISAADTTQGLWKPAQKERPLFALSACVLCWFSCEQSTHAENQQSTHALRSKEHAKHGYTFKRQSKQ